MKSQLFKAKNDHQVATGGKHGVLSCPQAAGRNAASTMLLHALGCYGVSTLVLTQPMVPTKTIFHTFASFLRTPFHPLQNLKSKETTKKITKKKNTMLFHEFASTAIELLRFLPPFFWGKPSENLNLPMGIPDFFWSASNRKLRSKRFCKRRGYARRP